MPVPKRRLHSATDNLIPFTRFVPRSEIGIARLTRAGAAFTLGVAFLLALAIPNAGSTTQAHPGSIRVADNLYVQAPGNEDLKHNIPDLEVVIGDQVLRADFLEHFRATGEIERWGYPTSEVLLMEGRTLTQFYQRGVVDFHNVGAGWVVERRLAWDYVGGGKGGSQDQGVEEDVLNPHEGAVVGPWGHKVSNFAIDGTEIGFADFFQRLGGVAAFGFPKTDARTDGKPPGTLRIPGASPGFIRQYFQAGVLEFHPGDTIAPVKLTLLGDTLRDILVKGWRTEPAFGAAAELVGGAAYDPYLVLPGDASRRLPAWFKEPPDNNHAAAASIFTQLYLSSPEIGAEVTGFPWVVDAISRDELVVLGKLHEVLGVDRETAGLMAAQLGNLESITPTRRLWIGEFADGLALVNPPAARTVAGAYWFQDGPNHLEAQVVATLAKVSTLDPNAAQTMANWPAVLNGISGRDLEGFQILDRIATFDTLSVTTIADLPWMSDGFDLYELHGLDSFYQIVRQNRGLARQILGQQWFTGGIDYWSQEVLNGLHGLQYESRELAHGIAGQAHPSRGLQEALYGLIDDLRTSEARPFLRITARDWFTDGLDDLDFAYATGLGFAAYRSQDLYAEFARARYHQTASFARPDGDRFEVFVFQNVPFEASENLADDAATAVRFAESFLQTPLPFNVLILLSLAPGTDVAVDLQLNDSFGRPVLLRRTGSAESNRRAIFRAVANQFIGHGPLWLREGQSQMMASQINAEAGIEDLDERAEELEQLVRRHCDSARRVSQVTELPRRGGQVPPCDSHLSELFMIELLDVMGPEGMGSALQRMIQVFLAERYDPFSSKDLHDQFFARTPSLLEQLSGKPINHDSGTGG